MAGATGKNNLLYNFNIGAELILSLSGAQG